ERAVHPAAVGEPPLIARAVVGAAPRRVGREVDVALPHGVAVGVGAALEVLALLTHGHVPTISPAPLPQTRFSHLLRARGGHEGDASSMSTGSRGRLGGSADGAFHLELDQA